MKWSLCLLILLTLIASASISLSSAPSQAQSKGKAKKPEPKKKEKKEDPKKAAKEKAKKEEERAKLKKEETERARKETTRVLEEIAETLPDGVSLDPKTRKLICPLVHAPLLHQLFLFDYLGNNGDARGYTRKGQDLRLLSSDTNITLGLGFSEATLEGAFLTSREFSIHLDSQRFIPKDYGSGNFDEDADLDWTNTLTFSPDGMSLYANVNGLMQPVEELKPKKTTTGAVKFSVEVKNSKISGTFDSQKGKGLKNEGSDWSCFSFYTGYAQLLLRGVVLTGTISDEWMEYTGNDELGYRIMAYKQTVLGDAPVFAGLSYRLEEGVLKKGLSELDEESKALRLRGEVEEVLRKNPASEVARFDVLAKIQRSPSVAAIPLPHADDSLETRMLFSEIALRRGLNSQAGSALGAVEEEDQDWRWIVLQSVLDLRIGNLARVEALMKREAFALVPAINAEALTTTHRYLTQMRELESKSSDSVQAYCGGKVVSKAGNFPGVSYSLSDIAKICGTEEPESLPLTIVISTGAKDFNLLVSTLTARGADLFGAAYWFDESSGRHRIILSYDPVSKSSFQALHHELWHAFAEQTLPKLAQLPWFNEGMAMHASTYWIVQTKNLGAALPIEMIDLPVHLEKVVERGKALITDEKEKRRPEQLEAARIMKMTQAEFYQRDEVDYNYAIAWAVVAQCIGQTPESLKRFQEALKNEQIEALALEVFDVRKLIRALEATGD